MTRPVLQLIVAVCLISQAVVSLGPTTVLCQEPEGGAQLELGVTDCCDPLATEASVGAQLVPSDDCGPCTDTSMSVVQDREQTATLLPPLAVVDQAVQPLLALSCVPRVDCPTPAATPPPTFHRTVVLRR